MPCLYSETHDDILTAFLKNKAKKINTDKRPMFGKNRNGHIFPITLQLQRVCFTPNDELIFIANMQLQKYNTAPVCCITDSYGTVLDFTSTFGFLFFKHEDKPGTKNIQELVPSFFQNIEEMLNSRHIVHFPERVHVTKKYQEGMFTFEAECLVVQAQPLGYLVQAKREKSTLGKVE